VIICFTLIANGARGGHYQALQYTDVYARAKYTKTAKQSRKLLL